MAQVRECWAGLIRDLMAEQGVSCRQLCRDTGINRSTLRRGLAPNPSRLPIDTVETVLAYLGYELDAIKREAA